MDINMSEAKNDVNHSPKIYYDFDKDDQNEPLDNGYFYLCIELRMPAPFYEVFQNAYGKE